MSQNQTYGVSAKLEYDEPGELGFFIRVRDKRIAWGNKGAFYYTHFHAHVDAKAPDSPVTHFKNGRGKRAEQGWDLKPAEGLKVLNFLRAKNLQKDGDWVYLN